MHVQAFPIPPPPSIIYSLTRTSSIAESIVCAHLSVVPFLAAVLELKMRIDSVQWSRDGKQSHRLEGAYI